MSPARPASVLRGQSASDINSRLKPTMSQAPSASAVSAASADSIRPRPIAGSPPPAARSRVWSGRNGRGG